MIIEKSVASLRNKSWKWINWMIQVKQNSPQRDIALRQKMAPALSFSFGVLINDKDNRQNR